MGSEAMGMKPRDNYRREVLRASKTSWVWMLTLSCNHVATRINPKDGVGMASQPCDLHGLHKIERRKGTATMNLENWRSLENWRPGDPFDSTMAEQALHRLWSETEYPPGKRSEHKRLWQLLQRFIEKGSATR